MLALSFELVTPVQDLLCIAAVPSLQDMAIFVVLHGCGHSRRQYNTAAVASNLPGTQSRLSQSLNALKEVAIHLLDLNASTTEPRFSRTLKTFDVTQEQRVKLALIPLKCS